MRFCRLVARRFGLLPLSFSRRLGNQRAIKFNYFTSDTSIDQVLNREVSMPPSLCYKRSGFLHFGIGQTSEMYNAPQFRFCVFEKQIVMRDQALLLAGRLDQAPGIDFPKPQTERIRRSVPLSH